MTSWIIGIDAQNPQHWGMAKVHRFWDMTRSRDFAANDTLYFWQGGGSLLGSVRVTRSTYELRPGTWMPWNLDDAKRADYSYRVEFEVLSSSSVGQPSWSVLTQNTGVRGATNFGPRRVPPEGEAWLEGQIDGVITEAEALADTWANPPLATGQVSLLEEDMRTRIEASIVLRQGQSSFRRKVLRAYESTCCITGSTLESVLYAAHIVPFGGSQTDVLENALLLRTDLHTLFDRHFLTVTPGGIVRLAPSLYGSEYAQYEGHYVRTPVVGTGPATTILEHHNGRCAWLTLTAT